MSAVLVGLIGCGPQPTYFAPVTGQVTLDGKPVSDAKILFVPTRYRDASQNILPYAYATTDKEGKYTLRSDGKRRGAAVGQHLVFISTKNLAVKKNDESPPEQEPAKTNEQTEAKPETIPSRYNTESQLYREVKRGTCNQFNFKLKSD